MEKCVCTIYGNTRRKANRYASKNGMYFSENLLGVNPVVTNYKIRHIKNRFSVNIFGVRKMKNTVWTCEASLRLRMYEGSHGGKFAQCVSQPEN